MESRMMDRLIGWTPPKFEEPMTNMEARRYIVIALSHLRSATEQLSYIPESAGGENVFHKPACIVEGKIHEARKLLHTAANNLDNLELFDDKEDNS